MADEPPSDSQALIELVDADHRDHGIHDRSVHHDCSGFHYPCPDDELPLLAAPCPYCAAAAGEPCRAVTHPRVWGKVTHYRRIAESADE